jgi:hypothetical protein
MKIVLDFKEKLGIVDIFKPTMGNLSLHKLSNDNAVKELQTLH